MRSKWSRVTTGPTKTCETDQVRAKTEQEQSKHDHAIEQKWKQRGTTLEESKAKEKESDRLIKKQCIQGESSRDRYDKRLLLKLFRQLLCHLHCYTSSPAPIPSTYKLHVVTMDIYLHILLLCSCVFLVTYSSSCYQLVFEVLQSVVLAC